MPIGPGKTKTAKQKIEGWLRKGRYAPGERLPSIVEMAKTLRMSDQPVRKAVAELARAGLLRPVNGVGVFVCDPGRRAARRILLVAGRPPSPPGVDPGPEAFLDWEMHTGIIDALRQEGSIPVWHVLAGTNLGAEFVVEEFRAQEAGGIITFRATFGGLLDAAVQQIGPHRIVSTHWSEAPTTLNEVRVRLEPGIYAALDKALELGHRSVAFLYAQNMAEHWSHGERFRIFTHFCAERGLGLGAGCMVKTGGRAVDGYRATMQLLDANPEVTLISACNDERAAGVLEALRDRGLTPGREVSVIGYDDMPGAAELQLATVRPPRREVGLEAVALLMKTIEAKQKNQKRWLETEAVFRDSLGPAARGRGRR